MELADVYMLLPMDTRIRLNHGFANANNGCVLCFWESGSVTFFTQKWSFDNERRGCNIEYTELECNDPPKESPRFSDNTSKFANTLADIAELADKINEKFRADIFRKAKDILY